MSSTNRGASRRAADYYPTPEPLARALIHRMLLDRLIVGRKALEPSAGSGRFVEAMSDMGFSVDSIEPREIGDTVQAFSCNCYQATLEDFAADPPSSGYDLIAGNPPFLHAQAHTLLCRELLGPTGVLGFMLPMGFLGPKGRVTFFRQWRPRRVYQIVGRPSFIWSWTCKNCKHKFHEEVGIKCSLCPECGNKSLKKTISDSNEYGLYVWGKDSADSTSLEFIEW